MTKKLFRLLLVLVGLSIYVGASCQLREQSLLNMDQVSIPSPNISNLGLFEDVPVSKFTGLPQIEVPLYTFNEGKLSIPITLSYHSSGFRPDVQPGWVGMGWSLNASAWAISRRVNGKPDDYDTHENEIAAGYSNPTDGYSSKSGYYFNRTLLDANQWGQLSYLTDLTTNDTELVIIGTAKDTEPDEFSFSFPNGSGKFFLDIDGSWKVDCDRAVTVTFDNVFLPVPFSPIPGSVLQDFGYYKTFSGFTITDTDGTKYVFGGSSDFIEYSIDFVKQEIDFWRADSWFLKEIIEPSGKKISFQYAREGFTNQLMMSFSQDFGTGGSGSGFWQPPCGLSEGSLRQDYSGRLISPLYMEEIKGDLGIIKFNKARSSALEYGRDINWSAGRIERDIYRIIFDHFRKDYPTHNIFPVLQQYYLSLPIFHNPPTNPWEVTYAYFYLALLESYQLDDIEIFNTNKRIKIFDFEYYPGGGRLSLKSVTEGNGNANIPPYAFEYHPVDDVPYFSAKVDHWGFYNGQLSDISQLDTDPSIYFNSRSADSTFAKQGVLKRITYPTGGYTQFQYEGNYADKTVPLDRTQDPIPYANQVGGLRIRKLTDVNLSNVSKNVVREYFYVKDYRNSANLSTLTSSGILGGQSLYLFKDFKVPLGGGDFLLKNQFNSLSQLPASSNSGGSHVGYSQVVEKRADNSYTIFYYSNFDNGYKDEGSPTTNLAFSPYGPYTSLERKRGKVQRVEQYTATDVLVYKKETTYKALDETNQFARAIRARLYNLCAVTWVSPYYKYSEATAYKNYTYSYVPLVESETIYDPNGNPITSRKEFDYNDFRLVKTVTSVNSDLKVHTYKSYYPFDFPNVAVYDEMKLLNMIRPVIKTEFLIGDAIKETLVTEYSKGLSSNATLILPSAITTQDLNNTPQIRMRFHSYDDRGNVLSFSKENDVRVNYLWSYAKNYPIAQISNVDYSVVSDVLGQANIESNANRIDVYGFVPLTNTNLMAFMATLRTDARLKDAQITTYLYDPLVGMTSMTDLNDLTTYYQYDSFERLRHVMDNDENVAKKYEYYYWLD